MRTRTVVWIVVGLVVVMAAVAVISVVRRGFSARDEPSAIETVAARMVRRMGVPGSARDARNPVKLSKETLADGRAHFADHCAICHGNDGSGNTTIGRNLYPKAPDMRSPDTQQLTDGELFYIIENGIRLTGMPAWGSAGHEDAEDSWKLVHFVRHLNGLTPSELKEMERMNPKSPDEKPETEMPHHKQ